MIEVTKSKHFDTGFRRPPLMNLSESYTLVTSTATIGVLGPALEIWETAISQVEEDVEVTIGSEALREAIVAMFKEREVLYPSEICEELGVDYERVMEVIAALSNEGAIQAAK